MNNQQPTTFHTPLIILAGLFAAQIIGTLQVYQSNTRLLATVEAVKNAGYLAIPNDLVAPSSGWTTLHHLFGGALLFGVMHVQRADLDAIDEDRGGEEPGRLLEVLSQGHERNRGVVPVARC